MVRINDQIQGTALTPGFTHEQVFRIVFSLKARLAYKTGFELEFKTGRFYEDEMYDRQS